MIEGVYVANVTPFRDDASFTLDVEAYLDHVTWLSEKGVQGVVPFGTASEGPSVALREKLEVLEALFDREFPLQIIPNVAQGSLPETLEMLAALETFPATAVMVLPPYYYKPVSPEGLMRFYEPVVEATSHPVILYHIPNYAVPIPQEVVKNLPVWGVKDSSGGEPGYSEGLLAAGKGVLPGTEEDLWQRLSVGAQGLMSGLANFVPEQTVELYQKVKAGDEVKGKALSERLQKVRAMVQEYGYPPLLKKLAEARHGVPLGTVRPPLLPPPANHDLSPILQLAEIA